MKKSGFTLVELSIVLVIIGLLVGGILVGQSLIDSAKINAQIRQIQQYTAIVRLFEDRFRQIPGDTDLFSPQGNNDGLISAVDALGDPAATGFHWDSTPQSSETALFWKHLSDSGMVQEKYTNVIGASGTVAGENYPEGKFDGTIVNAHSISGSSTEYSILAGKPANHFLAFSAIEYASNGRFSIDHPAFSVTTVLAIDQKIDDGLPYGGQVNQFPVGDTPGSNCVTGIDPNFTYNPTDEDATCGFIAELDAIF